MSLSGLSLQRAIVAALRSDAGVKTWAGDPARVFDDVPRGTIFPYVTVADAPEREIAASETDASEHTITIHVWSRQGGRTEARQLSAAIHARLHDHDLTLDGHRLINLRAVLTDAVREADAETYRAILRFRAVTEAAP